MRKGSGIPLPFLISTTHFLTKTLIYTKIAVALIEH